jgi:hypothetical protein
MAMAYRIFFSGLMAFVEYHRAGQKNSYDQVDVLLLNPCARHDAHGHRAKDGAHDEASCLDRHDPQLLVKSADIADWNLDGVLQGCGRHHFDLKETVFPKHDDPKLDDNRRIELPVPPSDRIGVDPFGEMQHLAFRTGIPDMRDVLNTDGLIDPNLPADIKQMVAVTVRLPKGKLTALAPLFGVARGLLGWTIGNQSLDVLAEVVMFEPEDQDDLRIEVGQNDFVTMRRNPDVTVWITNEPHHVGRTRGGDILKAEHFHHYYDLLQPGKPQTGRKRKGAPAPSHLELRPEPRLNPPFNIDNPLCPICLMHSSNRL